jgi:cytochrome oxidase Cu insertion factor (SCO1/SenC/PrrC family)
MAERDSRSALFRRLLLAVLLLSMALDLRAQAPAETPRRAAVPDVELTNQNGEKVRLHSDLVKGRVVALSFIFTSCTTICRTIGVNLGQVRKELGAASLERDVALISISVDPATDTPERLKAWGKTFGAGPGWTLLTGEKDRVTQLLKKLESYTPAIQNHSPFLLIVNDRTGEWQRLNALETTPQKIAAVLREEVRKSPAAAEVSSPDPGQAFQPSSEPAQRYFTDVQLTNQDGKRLRFYSDLLQGKIFVINSFFSSCTGVCKVTMPLFQSLQEKFADRPGKKLHLISISVDPEADTPAALRRYATSLGAKPGWDLLTGDKQSVELVLGKLGLATEMKEGHSNIFLVGNESTGLWKKVLGIGSPEEIASAVQSVLDDKP